MGPTLAVQWAMFEPRTVKSRRSAVQFCAWLAVFVIGCSRVAVAEVLIAPPPAKAAASETPTLSAADEDFEWTRPIERRPLKPCQFSLASLLVVTPIAGAGLAGVTYVASLYWEKDRVDRLKAAAAAGDIAAIKADLRPDSSADRKRLSNLIYSAIANGHSPAAEYLLGLVGEGEFAQGTYRSLAGQAVATNDAAMLRMVFDHSGQDPKVREEIFYRAVAEGKSQLARAYYSTEYQGPVRSDKGVIQAIQTQDLAMLNLLATNRLMQKYDLRLLIEALKTKNPQILQTVLSAGAEYKDLFAPGRKLNGLLLGEPKLIETFLGSLGKDDQDTRVRLMAHALYYGDDRDRELVFNHPSAADIKNKRWLEAAIDQERPELIDWLVANGAAVNDDEATALRAAVRSGSRLTVKKLIELGADLHANHEAALREAIRNEKPELARQLIEIGADPREAASY